MPHLQVSGLWILLAGVAQMILHSARRVVRARTFHTGIRWLRKLTSWNREAGGSGRGQLKGASSRHEFGELEAGAAAAANGGGHSSAALSWRQAGASRDGGNQQLTQQQGVAAEPPPNAELAAALDDVLAAVRRMEQLMQQAGQGSATPG